ncbi:hypothetical protein F52700_888 [Fusarium sp. NRRL 52700]|nr:hypothetical protein F52700_888 [Fusarium sp. NRRL 52700]
MEFYIQIDILLVHLHRSIKQIKGPYPGVFGSSADDSSGTIIPTPEDKEVLEECMLQVGPLVDGLVTLATEEWQQQLAERHKGRFALSQSEVLQILQDLKNLECAD